MAKVSNDKGQTWHYYKAFNDRVGNPVSRSIAYQSRNTTYVLGYDRIFYGRTSTDIRWSADDVRFSADDVTFAKLGNQTGLDFDVDSYNTFAKLPGNVSKYAEAMACSDDWLYVVAKNVVRRIALKQTPIDTDPSSPTFGEKIFDTASYTVVPGNDKIVVKKMDVMNGILYALVTGEVKPLCKILQNPLTWFRPLLLVCINGKKTRKPLCACMGTPRKNVFISSMNTPICQRTARRFLFP